MLLTMEFHIVSKLKRPVLISYNKTVVFNLQSSARGEIKMTKISHCESMFLNCTKSECYILSHILKEMLTIFINILILPLK